MNYLSALATKVLAFLALFVATGTSNAADSSLEMLRCRPGLLSIPSFKTTWSCSAVSPCQCGVGRRQRRCLRWSPQAKRSPPWKCHN